MLKVMLKFGYTSEATLADFMAPSATCFFPSFSFSLSLSLSLSPSLVVSVSASPFSSLFMSLFLTLSLHFSHTITSLVFMKDQCGFCKKTAARPHGSLPTARYPVVLSVSTESKLANRVGGGWCTFALQSQLAVPRSPSPCLVSVQKSKRRGREISFLCGIEA